MSRRAEAPRNAALRKKISDALAIAPDPDAGHRALDGPAVAAARALLAEWPDGLEARLGGMPGFGAYVKRVKGNLRVTASGGWGSISLASEDKYDLRAKQRFLKGMDRVVCHVEARQASDHLAATHGDIKELERGRKAIAKVRRAAKPLDSGPGMSEH